LGRAKVQAVRARRACPISPARLAPAAHVMLTVDVEPPAGARPQAHRHLVAVRSLVVILPEIEAGQLEDDLGSGPGRRRDPAVILVLIEKRRRLAVVPVLQIDLRARARPVDLAAAFARRLGPSAFERLPRLSGGG